jgi:hypothetical protein
MLAPRCRGWPSSARAPSGTVRGRPCHGAGFHRPWSAGVLARLADQRAQLLAVGGGYCVIQSPKASSSAIRRSRHCSVWCSARVSLAEPRVVRPVRRAPRSSVGRVELAHQLADKLHLAPLALEVGDALGLGQRLDAACRAGPAAPSGPGAQAEQVLPSFCSSVLSRLSSVRLGASPPLSSRLSSRSSSLPSATNWPDTK